MLAMALAFLTPLALSSCGPSAKAAGKAAGKALLEKGAKYGDDAYRIYNSNDD